MKVFNSKGEFEYTNNTTGERTVGLSLARLKTEANDTSER